MNLMGIGEFAGLAWLSPRALRLYDELGLLMPARVDPDTGYRWYAPAQLEQARQVASLRQLGLPLARIRMILGLDPAAAARAVAAWWAEAESSHVARRELAGYLIDKMNGKELTMYDIQVREMPARRVLCLLRHAHTDENLAIGRELIARLRPVATPQPGHPVTAPFAIYYGEVSQDSDGPVEWCWPVPDDSAEELAAQFPDLTLRSDAAHEEAFVRTGQERLSPAQLLPVLEGMGNWILGQHRTPTGGLRQLLISNPDSGGNGPDLEWALPLLPAGQQAATT